MLVERAPTRSRTIQRLRRNRSAQIGGATLIVLVLVAVFAEFLATHDPNSQSLRESMQPPSWDHLLGTDLFGRDIYSRLVFATRVTLIAAAEGLLTAVVLGVPPGLLAGYVGGVLDSVMSRIADALLSLPPLILALAIVGIAGPGLTKAMLAVGIVYAPRFFRISRSAALTVVHEPYIEAARAEGCSQTRIIARHVLPNASGPLIIQASFTLGSVILAEASLSFLGLGVQPPQASWGSMLREGFDSVRQAWFPLVPPAMMMVITTFAFATLGDALRDALGRDSRNDG